MLSLLRIHPYTKLSTLNLSYTLPFRSNLRAFTTKKDLTNTHINKTTNTVDIIKSDQGLTEFIKKTYLYTGGSITGTLLVSQCLSTIPINSFWPIFGGGAILALGGVIGLSYSKYSVHTKRLPIGNKLTDYWYSKNTPSRLLSYGALIGGMSLTLTPFISMINDISPTILPTSCLLTSFIFGGSTLYAMFKPNGALLAWQAPLMGGLMGLVGVSMIGLLSHVFMGPTVFSSALHSIDTYGGLLLFTAMTAYDTHKAVNMYQAKDPDHLGCSVNLYLDFMNMLIRMMEILAKVNNNNK